MEYVHEPGRKAFTANMIVLEGTHLEGAVQAGRLVADWAEALQTRQ